ncbi:hypothetical protein ACI780_06785 [Geodermatophilus sp. SYSU D00814]
MAMIGAVPEGDGSRVRVFAPNATSVRVVGDWNGWTGGGGGARAPPRDGGWVGHDAPLRARGREQL